MIGGVDGGLTHVVSGKASSRMRRPRSGFGVFGVEAAGVGDTSVGWVGDTVVDVGGELFGGRRRSCGCRCGLVRLIVRYGDRDP